MRHLERFSGDTVAGGRRERLPGTILREFRGRWKAEKDTWNAFAGKPWQVEGGKGDLERFCGNSVAGGRRERRPGTLLRGFRGRWEAGKATWNAFAGIPWQVEDREMPPGTLSRGYRARWTAKKDTWNAFAGIPWQVEDREMPPETLLQGFRARWAAGWDTWHSHSKSKITVRVTESLTAGSHGAKGLLWFLPPESRCERKKERKNEGTK